MFQKDKISYLSNAGFFNINYCYECFIQQLYYIVLSYKTLSYKTIK